MYHYIAYGLHIRSALPLAALRADSAESDVECRVAAIPRPRWTRPLKVGDFHAAAGRAYLRIDGAGACQVSSGREIVVEPEDDGNTCAASLLALGPAMTMLQQQRGSIVLHGSVVAIDGQAVAFLGDSGRGKSTMAATFFQRGHRVISDDLTIVRIRGGVPEVMPGLPHVRLLPDSARALGYQPERLEPIFLGAQKRMLPVAATFSPAPTVLRYIFLLSDAVDTTDGALKPQEIFLEIVRQYYVYAAELLKATGGGARLLQCATLANLVPVRRLRRHQLVGSPHQLAARVEQLVRQPPNER